MVKARSLKDIEVVVIGAGIFGLTASEQCALQGARKVTLIEREYIGHPGGSSHGRVRIARSAYAEMGYVQLMQRAFQEYWPQLARRTQTKLLHPQPAVIFGPSHGRVTDYYRGVCTAGADVVELSPPDRAIHCPYLRDQSHTVLLDRTAAVIDAQAMRLALTKQLTVLGCTLLQQTKVNDIESIGDHLVVQTTRGPIPCDRIICTAGPWTTRLIPELDKTLRVVRQNVGFYRCVDSLGARQMQSVWIYVGEDDNTVYYGLPEDGQTGKAAAHIRNGHHADFEHINIADEKALTHLDAFMKAQFRRPLVRVHEQTCLYTPAPRDDFLIDVAPADPRIVVAAGFSGHGFKFSPLIGAALAELTLDGQTAIEEFEALKTRFAWPAHLDKA